jgi:hypothetical protein
MFCHLDKILIFVKLLLRLQVAASDGSIDVDALFREHPAFPKRKRDFTFESFRKPWPNWTPCNQMNAYHAYCSPRKPQCNSSVHVTEGVTHGLGNNFMSLRSLAGDVYAKGCTMQFKINQEHVAGQYRTTDFIHSLDEIPNAPQMLAFGENGCVLFALLQSGPELSAVVATALSTGGSPDLPLVALHLRTGWADAAHELSGESQVGPGKVLNPCARDFKSRFSNATADAFGLIANVSQDMLPTLPEILAALAHAADASFGRHQWRFFAASDAPAVTHFAVARMAEQHGAAASFSVPGPAGHTAIRFGNDPRNDPDHARAVTIAGLADLFILSGADMFLNNQYSRYSMAAHLRATCPQRYLPLRGRIAGHVADLHMKLLPLIERERSASGSGTTVSNDQEALATEVDAALREWVQPNHPCLLASPTPLYACACYFKLAYDS